MIHATKFTVDPAWKILIKDLGIAPDELLHRVQLPLDLFSRQNARISAQEFFNLWNALEKSLNKPLFPLLIAKSLTPETFSPPIFASLCSPDLNTAMDRLSQFKPLIGPMVLEVEKTEKGVSLIIDCLYKEVPMPKSLAAMELVFLTNLARIGTREFITPVYISSKMELADIGSYAEFFGRMPVKGQHNQLIFSHEDATRPFITENPGMWNFFEPELRKQLSNLKENESFAGRVRSCLFEMLPSGRGASIHVAEKLGVSRRSLQRYLQNEGTTFQKELNKTRESLARYYLTNSTLPGSQIAFLLGFDDPNSFVRAFRSWTGTTPEKVRAQTAHKMPVVRD